MGIVIVIVVLEAAISIHGRINIISFLAQKHSPVQLNIHGNRILPILCGANWMTLGYVMGVAYRLLVILVRAFGIRNRIFVLSLISGEVQSLNEKLRAPTL